MQSKHVLLRVMGILCLICFITIGSTGCGSDKYVDLVRESTMQMEPNIKIGKAFDQYFANGEWNSYETKQKDRIVEFKGGCTWGKRSRQMQNPLQDHWQAKFRIEQCSNKWCDNE